MQHWRSKGTSSVSCISCNCIAVSSGASLQLSSGMNLQREGRHKSRLEDSWRERSYDVVGDRNGYESRTDGFCKDRTEYLGFSFESSPFGPATRAQASIMFAGESHGTSTDVGSAGVGSQGLKGFKEYVRLGRSTGVAVAKGRCDWIHIGDAQTHAHPQQSFDGADIGIHFP